MKKIISWLSLTALAVNCSHPGTPSPQESSSNKLPTPTSNNKLERHYPATAQGTISDSYFGHLLADPYRWLENQDAPEVREWVRSQQQFTANFLSQEPLQTLRNQLTTRLQELLDYTKTGRPVRRGDYLYYWKHLGLKPQEVYFRKKLSSSPTDSEEIVLDPNTFSADGTIAAHPLGFDKNYRYMVYSVSKAGSDWQSFVVKDLHTLRDLHEKLEWIKFSGAAFAGDGFYYQGFPQPQAGDSLSGINKDAAIYYHRLGERQSADRRVFANPREPLNTFSFGTTDDEDYLLISENLGTYGNALHYLHCADKTQTIHPLVSDKTSEINPITVIDGKIIALTDRSAANFRLVSIDPAHPQPADWQDLIPENKEHKLVQVSFLNEIFLARYLVDVTSKIKRFDRHGTPLEEVSLPGLGTVLGFEGKEAASATYYSFTSYTEAETIYHYDVKLNKSTLYLSSKASIKVDTDNFVSEQVFYTSQDGTRIPMFIIYGKGLKRDGRNPTMLYGYGGFNHSLEPSFSSMRFAFLERGGIIAIPNLRGGGEYGEGWHRAGMKQAKQNGFDDFIAAAEYLISRRYTSSAKLAINGGSNGGLLVGAVMTQRPELMKVAIPEVGVLDMLRFHKFTIGHAWAVEYGSSDESEEMFKYLLGYSPLHRVRTGTHYPATLIMTSDHDDRVVPAHSFKFAAALQAAQAGDDPLLLHVTSQAGHGAGSSLQQQIGKAADKYAFILYHTSG